jgi:hypothetical protein
VGCDFNGFFVEVALGYMPALVGRLPIKLLQGRCSDDFLAHKLTAREAAIYKRVQVEDLGRSPFETHRSIAIEHAEPCKIREFSEASRPVYVISRTMSEGMLDMRQAHCFDRKKVDEIWVPTHWHKELFERAHVRPRVSVVPETIDLDLWRPSFADRTYSHAPPPPPMTAAGGGGGGGSACTTEDDLTAALCGEQARLFAYTIIVVEFSSFLKMPCTCTPLTDELYHTNCIFPRRPVFSSSLHMSFPRTIVWALHRASVLCRPTILTHFSRFLSGRFAKGGTSC